MNNEKMAKELMTKTKEVMWESIKMTIGIDDLLELDSEETEVLRKSLKLLDDCEKYAVNQARTLDLLYEKIEHLERLLERR